MASEEVHSGFINQTLHAFVFSITSLYLFTAVLVMWQPDSIDSSDQCPFGLGKVASGSNSTDANECTESSRITSGIVANSTLLALAGLLVSARLLSTIGDTLVDLVANLVNSADEGKGEEKSLNNNSATAHFHGRSRVRILDDL
tara:strand:+ start:4447 stop:4878 length:432 start_codon:yes stop_codon:yes gene_type:complete